MKVVVEKKSFISAMGDVLKVVEQKPIIPMMGYGVLKGLKEGNALHIYGSDNVHMLYKSIPASIEGEDETVIFNIHKVYELCKKINEPHITFTIENKNMKIKSIHGKYELICPEDPINFPVLSFTEKNKEEAVILTVDKNSFVESCIKAGKYINLKDTLRPITHNVYVEFLEDKTIYNSVNSTGSIRIINNTPNTTKTKMLIGYPSLKVLSLLNGDEVQCAIANGIYSLISGNTKLVIRSVDGAFPDVGNMWKAILSEKAKSHVACTFDRDILIGAIERLESLSNQNTFIKITLNKGELIIKNMNIDGDKEAVGEEKYECMIDTENNVRIIATTNLLKSGLSILDSQDISISVPNVNGNIETAYILSDTADSSETDILLMPYKIN